MNAMEQVRERILAALPGAAAEIDQPADPLGNWMLDVRHGGRVVFVEWRPRRGRFGISARAAIGPFDGPDELLDDADEAADRVVFLLQTGSETSEPAELGLDEIRDLLAIPQERVAEALGSSQVAVSRLERRSPDILLGSLRRFVEALGGALEVKIRVGDRAMYLRGFGPKASPASS